MGEYILLDTDVYSYIIKNHPEAEQFRPNLSGKIVSLSFITVGELYYGAYKNEWGQRRLDDLRTHISRVFQLPYNEQLPFVYGELVASCQRRGKPIMSNDAWIAATAILYSIPLLTNNTRHFKSVQGLTLL